MGNLRELVESDLAYTLEDPEGFGLPVILIAPNGTTYDKSANDEAADLTGQILYDSLDVDPETGAEIIVHKPVVTLRRSSLEVIPGPNEKWVVKIPTTPSYNAEKESFYLERPTEHGGAIGFIRLYLMAIKQSE